jgi:hypothetical protein
MRGRHADCSCMGMETAQACSTVGSKSSGLSALVALGKDSTNSRTIKSSRVSFKPPGTGCHFGIAISRLRQLLVVSVFMLPVWAFAWGATGHQVIGTLAEKQLTASARAQVQTLLALEAGSTLASISTWADERKNSTTARWHFINFPRTSCNYDHARDCPDGNCLLGAIDRQSNILKSEAPDLQRLQALKYLVHFIGDLHQPLHLGYLDDRGGNQYQIQAYKRGSNLHALWDSGLIKFVSDDPQVWVDRLSTKPLAARVNLIDPARVAEESCRIVAAPRFYPDRKVEAPYVDRWTPVLEQQLVLGGSRLARMLNGLWP